MQHRNIMLLIVLTLLYAIMASTLSIATLSKKGPEHAVKRLVTFHQDPDLFMLLMKFGTHPILKKEFYKFVHDNQHNANNIQVTDVDDDVVRTIANDTSRPHKLVKKYSKMIKATNASVASARVERSRVPLKEIPNSTNTNRLNVTLR
eukprot:940703_1